MNRCCKNLLVKNINSINSLNKSCNPNESINNYRILSTIVQYSIFNKSNIYNHQSAHLPRLTHTNTQIRLMAKSPKKNRETSKKNTNRSQTNHSNDNRYLNKNSSNNNINTKIITEIKPEETEIFKPLEVKPILKVDENIGLEFCGKLEKADINKILILFRQDERVTDLALEAGLNAKMMNDVLLSFRKFCLQSKALPADLHIKLSDIIKQSGDHIDLFPYFLRHAHELFPHLNCMDDLKNISDLTEPAFWYVEARDIQRKIIYHAGPTNSGKTYSALMRFQNSDSGIYCGPLKLLANEVFIKTNKGGRPCDLITGEERKFGDVTGKQSDHVACTVEMANLDKNYDVAIIDEIQMIKDPQRGWAWTRALLGLKAKEIHVCGDMSSTDLISELSLLTGDEFELKTYERLTPLNIMKKALGSFDNVEPGDCFVCFNKNDIYFVVNSLESKGHDVAVIYGSMPPGVKIAQAAKFNDPNDKCKILVATDAIGMGLNLNIRRIIFFSLKKVSKQKEQPKNDSSDNTELLNVTTSQALQIAGRAGRFNTAFKDGFVTTFKSQDLPDLVDILKQPLEKTTKAGLHPTAEQIELFGYHLPNQTLSELIKIFMSVCKIDNGQYFMCNFDEIVFLAEMIDHIPIKLKAKYTFATSPISRKQTFVCSCFVKFVRFYSNNEVVTDDILKKIIDWPLKTPRNMNEIAHLESVYDVLDLYLWLSFRFPDIFAYTDAIKQMKAELEEIIYEGVTNVLIMNQSDKRFRHKINRKQFKREEPQNLEQIKNMFENKNYKENNSNNQYLDKKPVLLENEVRSQDPINDKQSDRKKDIEQLDEKIDQNELKVKYVRLIDYLKSSTSKTKIDNLPKIKKENQSNKSEKKSNRSLIEESNSAKESFKTLLKKGAIKTSLKSIKNNFTNSNSKKEPDGKIDENNKLSQTIKGLLGEKRKNS